MEDIKTKQDKGLILIVDDNPNNLKVIAGVLGGEYSLSFANNGHNALKLLEKISPDLILLDVMMPGMNGFEVCKYIKESRSVKDIPIIFLTAKAEPEDIKRGYDMGAVDYITKPFNTTEIKMRVKTHLCLYKSQKVVEFANKEKDKLFSIISHELKNMFTSIIGLSEILVEEIEDTNNRDLIDCSKRILTTSNSSLNLLSNLLVWSKVQVGKIRYTPTMIVVDEFTSEVLDFFKEQLNNKSISINHCISGDSVFESDRDMLGIILRNLIENAIKFSYSKSVIDLTIKTDTRVEITVKDYGVGIDDLTLKNLFNIEFNTGKPGTAGEQSTGLGLFIIKDLVDRMGGYIQVNSKEGKGSEFTVSIPFARDISQKTTLGVETQSAKESSLLIVEDDRTTDLVLTKLLNTRFKNIYHASNGKEAVDICRSNTSIDIILMDILMPEMDGLEATRKIREFNKEVIIISQTVMSLPGEKEATFDAGCNDYIAKPINPVQLFNLIDKYIQNN